MWMQMCLGDAALHGCDLHPEQWEATEANSLTAGCTPTRFAATCCPTTVQP